MNLKEKVLAALMAVVIGIGVIAPTAAFAATEVRVTLHGEEVDFRGENPVLSDGRTYVPYWFIAELAGDAAIQHDTAMLPLRSTMESLGHVIEWNGTTMTANIRLVTYDEDNVHAAAAASFMDFLAAGDYGAATGLFAPEIQQAMLAVPLQVQISGRLGELLDHTMLGSTEVNGLHIFAFSTAHTKGEAVLNIAVNSIGVIAGFETLDFVFRPDMPPENANYTAEAVVIGEGGDWPLEGLLTMPHAASAVNPVPALIFVPGSGANNMDASMFANRPFFDISGYLSSNGIAVLRFNERTFSHGVQFAQVFGTNATVWDEYIEDVLLIVELLRADDRIGDVFILGHSLGGIVAPRIAEEAGLSGAILMASSPRPLHMISFDQNMLALNDMLAMGALSPEDAEGIIAALNAELEVARRMPDMTEDELQNTLLFGALSAVYEMSLVESLPLPIITRSDIPVLILQGSRDFQTTAEVDFQMFVDGTQGMAHVTAILYEGLNHFMMTAYRQHGELIADVLEYVVPGNVHRQVLRDITDWILSW